MMQNNNINPVLHLYSVSGEAISPSRQVTRAVFQLVAALDSKDAIKKTKQLYVVEGFEIFEGIATLIDVVDGYKVVLVTDEQA